MTETRKSPSKPSAPSAPPAATASFQHNEILREQTLEGPDLVVWQALRSDGFTEEQVNRVIHTLRANKVTFGVEANA